MIDCQFCGKQRGLGVAVWTNEGRADVQCHRLMCLDCLAHAMRRGPSNDWVSVDAYDPRPPTKPGTVTVETVGGGGRSS